MRVRTIQQGHEPPTFSKSQRWARHLASTLPECWKLTLHPLLTCWSASLQCHSLAWTTVADHPDRKCPNLTCCWCPPPLKASCNNHFRTVCTSTRQPVMMTSQSSFWYSKRMEHVLLLPPWWLLTLAASLSLVVNMVDLGGGRCLCPLHSSVWSFESSQNCLDLIHNHTNKWTTQTPKNTLVFCSSSFSRRVNMR